MAIIEKKYAYEVLYYKKTEEMSYEQSWVRHCLGPLRQRQAVIARGVGALRWRQSVNFFQKSCVFFSRHCTIASLANTVILTN